MGDIVMFDKKKNMIRIFIYENVMLYPPTLNLIECLLNNDYKVHLVAEGVKNLPTITANSCSGPAWKSLPEKS